jgi:nitrate/nitrite transporter NarK
MRSGQRATLNLTLATIAFTICFTSWGLVAPLAKHLQAARCGAGALRVVAAAPRRLAGDRLGGRLIFTVTIVLSIVPALLLGYVTSYHALFGGRSSWDRLRDAARLTMSLASRLGELGEDASDDATR